LVAAGGSFFDNKIDKLGVGQGPKPGKARFPERARPRAQQHRIPGCFRIIPTQARPTRSQILAFRLCSVYGVTSQVGEAGKKGEITKQSQLRDAKFIVKTRVFKRFLKNRK